MKADTDPMSRLTFILIFTAILLSACNQPLDEATQIVSSTEIQKSPTVELSGVPTIEATIQLMVYPPETRTGVTELDNIIDEVLAHDFEALRGLTDFTVIACTHVEGLGGPPKCAPNEVEGTLLEVVPFLGPEGHHKRDAEYQEWSGPDVLGLLAVYRVSSEAYSDEAYPAGEFALVFLDGNGAVDLTLQVRQGRVVRYDYGFGDNVESDLELQSEEVLLPLSFGIVPTAVPWKQFADPNGRFSFTYLPAELIVTDLAEDTWRMGDQIQIEVQSFGASWIACFDQALGDCPVVETDDRIQIQGREVRRVKGWFGSVGGRIPQEFLVYIFNVGDEALLFTLFALPFDAELSDITTVWPLEGMALELFERSVETVTINE